MKSKKKKKAMCVVDFAALLDFATLAKVRLYKRIRKKNNLTFDCVVCAIYSIEGGKGHGQERSIYLPKSRASSLNYRLKKKQALRNRVRFD